MNENRQCSECGEVKEISSFPRKKNGHHARQSYCKTCSRRMTYEKSYVKVKLEYEKKQFAKQILNACLSCKAPLIGYMLNSKYCQSCKEEIRRVWKKNDYTKNRTTRLHYYKVNSIEVNGKNRIREQRRREEVTDRYVTKLLREKHGFTPEQLRDHPQIVEVKRLILKIKRACRTSQNSGTA